MDSEDEEPSSLPPKPNSTKFYWILDDLFLSQPKCVKTRDRVAVYITVNPFSSYWHFVSTYDDRYFPSLAATVMKRGSEKGEIGAGGLLIDTQSEFGQRGEDMVEDIGLDGFIVGPDFI